MQQSCTTVRGILRGLPGLAFSRPKKQICPFLKLVDLEYF